ncbi:PREDICTED: uncharacterized protein LOC109240808 [Nicotiana attenuata]|uniref:Integral membrane bound transporter domain-containing protein n=1 Tax=Nicotiana attenuata TaxID=49451 RepID=A0A314L729_NICAT|nr:PREDICTED: uncharacterized protein LOC109240808 [Nicotiana attenuata]OIT37426.1 hypothetical protein A4A49_03047 [Nicotiana attenuata]
MATSSFESIRARAVWRTCLASAFRTALACSIVGVATLFGPECFKTQVAFPAFSYVTVILIITNATLGDTLRCCWLALYATVQGVCPAILSLWLIGPARLMASTTAIAVALSAFVVVLPENTHLIAKRIALGQLVIVYVIGYINGGKTEPVMHPIHVAASTAVGVGACVLALLLPYPNLACCEVKEKSRLFVENASERINLFVKAFSAEDKESALALISQAKSLVNNGPKLLQAIKSKQESMKWERFPFKFLRPYGDNPGNKFEEIQTPLRGMEIALEKSPPFPLDILNSELKDGLETLSEHISKQVKNISLESATVPESNAENAEKFLQTLQTIQPTKKDLPSLFFLFCLKLLLNKPTFLSSKKESKKQDEEERYMRKTWTNLAITINSRRFMAAFKLSLSLGLAIFFGSIYSKDNGFWAGLPVAISLAATREATFKVANVKAQGTVLGTVYGVLGCFLFERFVQTRFLSLLPWFIVSSFLSRSRMYGQAGGISAVIGAVLILGRKGFGPPSEFAIARITETFIGLSCSIMVEILLQPTRASTLAKIQLSKSFGILHECIDSISFSSYSKNSLEESQKKLKFHVNELGKFIAEADAEPNFWFLPFSNACYGKLMGSLSKMVEYLLFGSQALRFLEQESEKIDNNMWKTIVKKLDADLMLFKDLIGSYTKCFEEVSLVKSLVVLDKEFEKKKVAIDLELGKLPTPYNIRSSSEEEIEKNLVSFLQHSNEVVDVILKGGKNDEKLKGDLVLSLSAFGFCMDNLVKETKEIEKGIKELVQWENPSCHVNLYDISCKVRALANTETN